MDPMSQALYTLSAFIGVIVLVAAGCSLIARRREVRKFNQARKGPALADKLTSQ